MLAGFWSHLANSLPVSQDTVNPSASSPSAVSRNMPLFPTTSSASASTSPTVADQRREQLAAGLNDAKKGLNQFISNLRGERSEDRDHPPSGQTSNQLGHGQNRASVDERERIEKNDRERERERAEAGTMRAMKAKREAEDAGQSSSQMHGQDSFLEY
jgi:hypothetical protein